MKVFVIGATGVLGRNVVPRLVERGHQVRAVVRQPRQAEILRRIGVEAVVGDIFDRESLREPVAGCEAALHLATAIPPPGPHQDWSRNDRLRREGIQNLLAAATEGGVRRYVQQSITSLYGDTGAQVVDESAPLSPRDRIQSAADMEAMVRQSALAWCILRGGALYGPHTGREERWRDACRAGSLRLPGDGSALISLIHEVDFARAIVQAAESAPASSTYNVVDDEPLTFRDLLGYLAAQLNAPAPQPGGELPLPSLGCSNARLKAALGWAPTYSTYRSGLA
jgi:nucleoside-diphosphate-sugar epimerase